MFKTDILFTGFYGFQNTGDDAFVEVASWGAREIWGKQQVRFLSKDNILPETVHPSKAYPYRLPKTYRMQLELLLRNTDYLISAGGSTIHSKMASSNLKMKALDLKKKGRDIKLGGIGVSVGPFKSSSDERAVIDYLKRIDFLAVRDQSSYDFVSNLNLPYQPVRAFDLAALLPEIYNFDVQRAARDFEEKVIGISVCPYESLDGQQDIDRERIRNRMIVDLIKKLDMQDNIQFNFYIINGNNRIGDRFLTEQTIEKAKPKKYRIINYNKKTRDMWESISECDFVITTRLHAAIFACFANTPFMLNEYHRKCADFLSDVGYNNDYRLFNSDYDIDSKANQILEIVNNSGAYSKPLATSRMIELARLNFTSILISD